MKPFWVADSSIWFDLAAAGLLEKAVALHDRWTCPDVLLEELRHDPEGSLLVSLGVEICELSGAEVASVLELAREHFRPSRLDLFALVLARRPGGLLLTGDADLRRVAESLGVEVHGVLWILDRLVDAALPRGRAARALEKILARGSRLPEVEVRKRLDRWG